MQKLKVAIAGAGGAVAKVHLEAYRSLATNNLIDVVAGADTNQQALAGVCGQWGIRGYDDIDMMLEREKPDIVCVCVPARFHREVAEQVAAHGVHILIEKPLATTLEDAQAIIDCCRDNNVKLYYGASYRTLTASAKAREIIQRGELGEISAMLEIVAGGRGLEHYQECGPLHYPKGTPGGSGMGLVDHGVHLADLFCWFMDSPVTSVYGRGNISGDTPMSEHLTMTFANGAVAHLIANDISFPVQLPGEGVASWGGGWQADGEISLEPSWSANPASYQIHGSQGALRVFPYAQQLFQFSAGQSGERKVSPVQLEHHPMPGNFTLQMASFCDSIRQDTAPAVSGEEGLNALRIILAAYRSFEQGEVIRL